jgi:hypothetical protein
MRFVVKKYEDGSMFAVEATDDGSAIIKSLAGSRQVGQRLSAFVEVLGDDTDDGARRISEALEYLQDVIAQRAANRAKKSSA